MIWGDFQTWAMDEDAEYKRFLFTIDYTSYSREFVGKLVAIIETEHKLILGMQAIESKEITYAPIEKIIMTELGEKDADD